MAYNDAEHALHQAFQSCIRFAGDARHITSRINGTHGLVAIIEAHAQRVAEIDSRKKSLRENIELSLSKDGFSQIKQCRDSVVHARILDMSSGVAVADGRQGSRVYVLLTDEALEILYTSLSMLRSEIDFISSAITYSNKLIYEPESDREEDFLRGFMDSISGCEAQRALRKSLPSFPGFPSEKEILELVPYTPTWSVSRPGK